MSVLLGAINAATIKSTLRLCLAEYIHPTSIETASFNVHLYAILA